MTLHTSTTKVQKKSLLGRALALTTAFTRQIAHGVAALSAITLLSICIRYALAESGDRERARYGSAQDSPLSFTPVSLQDGSRLTLISPQHWSDIADEVSREITKTHTELSAIFGAIPAFRSSVRLIDEKAFYDLTGAPGWTNAMFFRGEIMIPLSSSQPIDLENIHRSVKHEYSHAVLSALSNGRIPGWIDEGLAQWAEGEENPALRSTLKYYLRSHEPVPLAYLQGGFTKLEASMVPAAYAQSLLAAQAMIKAYGIEKIALYLSMLRQDIDKYDAFEAAFGISQDVFERKLDSTLKSWAKIPRQKSPTTAVKTTLDQNYR